MRLAPAQIARTVVGGEERIKESLSATRAQHLPASAHVPLFSQGFAFSSLGGEGTPK
jgi:hypothetical protein